MKELRMFALAGAALLVVSLIVGSTSALAQYAGPTPLTLINGWTNAPFGTSIATVEEVAGFVQFRGAIATAGTNAQPFVLPPSLSPATNVYVPIDLCNATNGRLHIQSNGTVTVEVEGGVFSNAQCFTSLDGASFALNATGSTPLTLINGWTNAPFGTSNAAVRQHQAIVHLQGAIATTGTNAQPFVLPLGLRPTNTVYVPIDLCNATKGRLQIQPSGTVTVQAEKAFSNAQCFTSLDGAWFVSPLNGAFRAITLINGWTGGAFGTHQPEVGNNYGIVYFQGAISSGSNAAPFLLGAFQTPVTTVYIPIDLCNATKGRLVIQNNGSVTIQQEGGGLTNAQCFTSLDGVSFVQ
jgi:hypothetical protein